MSAKIKKYGKIVLLILVVLIVLVIGSLTVTWTVAQTEPLLVELPEEVSVKVDLVQQDVEDVLMLLDQGELGQANTKIDQIKSNYDAVVESIVPLDEIVEKYEDYDLDQAKSLAAYIIKKFPETDTVKKLAYSLGRYSIEELIDTGQTEEIVPAVQQWQSSYSDQKKVDKYLYKLARRCSRQGQNHESAEICNLLAAAYPASHYVEKAALLSSRGGVFEHIQSGDDASADIAIEHMRKDFSNNPDLVQTLNEAAERYLYSGRQEKALTMLMEYRDAYPNDEEQIHILMNIASAAVYTKDDVTVHSAMDQLIMEHDDQGRKIAQSLFCVANHYRLTGDYEKERRLYRYVSDRWFGVEPSFWQQWVKVYSRIICGERSGVDQQIESLISTCPEDKRTSRFFYLLANACHRMGDIDSACRLYQVSLDRWPMEEWTLSSRLALILLDPTQDNSIRQEQIDDYYNQYYGHNFFAVAAYRTACDLYHNAEQKQLEGLHDLAIQDYETVLKALSVVEGEAYDRGRLVIKRELNAVKANCLYQLGLDEQVIAVCEAYINSNPVDQGSDHLRMVLAHSWQRLLHLNSISKDQLSAVYDHIETAYRVVLESAADPSIRAQASEQLAWFYQETNQLTQAAEYFEYFLSTDEHSGAARDDAAFALRQVYLELAKPTLAEDVTREFFEKAQTDRSEIMGSDARLAALSGA